jgi:hypothetical protein
MTTCEEVSAFMTKFTASCGNVGVSPQVALTVMLFETGSSLSAWFTNGQEAFGLLQWTKAGCEPVAVQKAIGIEAPAPAKRNEAYVKMKQLNRQEQLRGWEAYYKYWYVQNAKDYESIKDAYLKHYVLTLAPNGGPKYKDSTGFSASDIVQGKGPAGKNFEALKLVAADMLSGKKPVPGEDPKPQVVNGNTALNKYLKAVGSCAWSGEGGGAASSTGSSASGGKDSKQKTITDLLPVELSLNIPEYPALVGMKPGDVLILPKTSQLRDWVVVSIDRTFTAGMNILSIKASRPLEPKAFVQEAALGVEPKDPMAYYYGTSAVTPG